MDDIFFECFSASDVSTEVATGGVLCFIKKSILKNFAKFTGKHLYWSLF